MDALQAAGGALHRLFPGRLAEDGQRVDAAHVDVAGLRRIVAADQRLGQALRRHGVVEAEAALDAEPVLVGVAVATVDLDDPVVLDRDARLAADAAERAERVDDLVELLDDAGLAGLVHQRLLEQRAGRAGLHALAAGDAGRQAHRVVHVEDGHHVAAALGHADHVVDLHFAAGAHAGAAGDAGVEVDGDGRVGDVELGVRVLAGEFRAETAVAGDSHRSGPVPEQRLVVRPGFGRPHVAGQQFEHHLARLLGALGVGLDHHARRRLADAGGRQHALALDIHHAGAAIAVGAVAGQVDMAQMRDLRALALGDFPDGLAGLGRDRFSVEREFDFAGHFKGLPENVSADD